ncbi:unnamed protein product, partial [Meganyctiphanes norvegica]
DKKMDHTSKKQKVDHPACDTSSNKYVLDTVNDVLIKADNSAISENKVSITDHPNQVFEQFHAHSSSSERNSDEFASLQNMLMKNNSLLLNRKTNVHIHRNVPISSENSQKTLNYISNENIVRNNSILSGLESKKNSHFNLGNNHLERFPNLNTSQSIVNYSNFSKIPQHLLLLDTDSNNDLSLPKKTNCAKMIDSADSQHAKQEYNNDILIKSDVHIYNQLLPSTIYNQLHPCTTIADRFMEMEQRLCQELLKINYYAGGSKITHVYNPIDYASEIHQDFLTKFCRGGQKVLLLGMNPGPWGMGQTG